MKHYQKIIIVAAAVSAALLTSCSKNSTNDLHDVQLCLNKAEAGSAQGCVDKISDNTTPLAYSLRCSAIFIDQGFGSAASFVDALDSINGGSSGCGGSCSSTISAINALKFSAAGVTTSAQRDSNVAAANQAFDQCSLADAKIYSQIASLFKLGTLAAMTAYQLGYTSGPGGTPSEADLKNALSGLDTTTVGTIVEVTYDTACKDTTNASDSTKEYCSELEKAKAGGATTAQIGDCLLAQLATPNYTGPRCPTL